MVKHLCLENYQAAANAALKFPPLRRELVKAVTSAVRTEVRSYSRGKSMAKYDGDPLNLRRLTIVFRFSSTLTFDGFKKAK